MPRDVRHIPVLLPQVLDLLQPAPGKTIVDCTVGLAGHSSQLLARGAQVIGLDMDPANLELANTKLASLPGSFQLHHSNFAALPTILASAGLTHVHGVLADLGVASPQIDNPARGFSYRQPGPLDMRMDPTRGQPASTLVNRMSEQELANALLDLGDETDAPQIAKLVVQHRQTKPIETTQDLMAIVCQARNFTLKRAAGAKLHPAARTFQALRMLVNRELPNLQRLLDVLPDCLAPQGVAAIISFHSGEDRLVKRAFRMGLETGAYSEISPDPLTATDQEIQSNPRSRSAKLRFARRA